MPEKKFLFCKHCGNMVGMIRDSGVEIICCGEPMIVLTANTEDASKEKHVPVISVEGNQVSVRIGSDDHPMIAAHYIDWIYLLTEQGGQRKDLKVDGPPAADFALTAEDKPLAAYAYCNLHGLWMAKA